MSKEKLLAALLVVAPVGACGNGSQFEGDDVLQVCDVRLSPRDNAVRIERYVEEIRAIEAQNADAPNGGTSPRFSALRGGLSIPLLVERERDCTSADWAAAEALMFQRN